MASDPISEYLTSLFGLQGKTALLTGGTRGIGHGLSIALASAGANIILLARSPSSPTVTSTATAIRALGRTCTIYTCDLASRAALISLVSRICVHDGYDIDILVHSGGMQHRAAAAAFPDEQWDAILDVNLTAAFVLSRSFAQHWLAASAGDSAGLAGRRKKIIFVGSVLCFSGSAQVAAYVASKHAVAGVVKALNNEWMGRGINVNCLAPGYVETRLTAGIREDEGTERAVLERVPMGRWGVPEDLAGAVVHLAGRGSDFVGGEVYVVDGGFNGR